VVTVTGGRLTATLNPMSAILLLSKRIDLQPPAAPTGLHVTAESNAQVSLAWNTVSGSANYNVYHSPLSGGGWVKVNTLPVAATSFTNTGLNNGETYYYIVRALDALGNESNLSNEVSALPHYTLTLQK
jgi:fibronectin type 3 domain-containing protein